MYAIELFFSSEVEDYVRRKWKELSINQIATSLYEIEGVRPHITLALYNELDSLEDFRQHFTEYFKTYNKMIELKFDIIGTFPTTGTVFLKPTITTELMDFHRAYHNAFQGYSKYENQYYLPDNWGPHCTLAMSLQNDAITRTIEFMLKDFKPLRGSVIEIGVVEVLQDGKKCVSTKTLFSKKLKESYV